MSEIEVIYKRYRRGNKLPLQLLFLLKVRLFSLADLNNKQDYLSKSTSAFKKYDILFTKQ
ncbi:hypothetical protein IW492_10365 [Enterococcus sp. BWB1-3]|uniref:hypothetical protein n=1 Tax=unclassified Enterococcus TaxID=2608891 RepID=UPI001921089F|nr:MULTISPECIES: hypothetical protein [unclassified Enterococcus]MBL1229634.1 hypothetical protein [Enterococcus sp. BWB1-3]MCB5954188.1 hypothetical protein [Enterococcus sp. CWB-B31]